MASTWFGMERRLRFTMLRLFLFASFVGVALAGEWNCADTSGTFTLSNDCTMTNEVLVSGDLAVTGNETVYTKIFAASGKRHFKITDGAQTRTLRLKWLNMTGADISGNSGEGANGGSIFVFTCFIIGFGIILILKDFDL